MMLIGNELRRLTERCPHREALVFDGRRWSFGELNVEVNRLTHALNALGVRAGDRIAISLSNRPELFLAYFAAQKLGAVAVLLNYSLTAGELTYIGRNCAPKVWFCDSRTAAAVEEASSAVEGVERCISCGAGSRPPRAISFEDLITRASDAEPPPSAIDGSAPSLIMYTSGTTGRPKGVVLSHAAQWINTILMIAELGFQATDRALQFAPLFHVAAFHVVALPVLFVGGSNIVIEKYDAGRVSSWLDRYGATTVLGAPTHFELWSAAGHLPTELSRERLRHVIITGAPARLDTIHWITERISPRLWDVYGQTEACSLITIVPPDQTHRMSAVNCIGRPLIGMDVTLVPERAPVREGLSAARPRQGELIARGPKLMNGYYLLPEKTEQTIEEGWLRTGDLVKVDDDGYYYYLGRVDDMIITGGENVYPAEIEEFLLTCPGVKDCVVVGVPDPVWGQLIAAYIVPDGRFDQERAEQLVRQGLAPHKRPRRWLQIPEVPRNPSGKVLVRKLRELTQQAGSGDGHA